MSFKLPSAASFKDHPAIRRSRGFRLYTPQGTRFLDLYQDAGRGMLGSRPKGLVLRFKNSLDKMGSAALPSVWNKRACKVLKDFFPDHPWVCIFPSFQEAAGALGASSGSEAVSVWDPIDSGYGMDEPKKCDGPCIWRPFLPVPSADVLVPMLPGAGTWGGVFVLSRKSLGLEPPPLPSFLLAPQVYAAGRFFEWLSTRNSDSYAGFPEGPWLRRGPYLFPACNREDYSGVVRSLISCGLYPSPDYTVPSIIPAEYDEGEIKKLRDMEGKWNSA